MAKATSIRVANVVEEGKLGGPQVRMVRVAAGLAGQVETLIVMPKSNSGAFRRLCKSNAIAYHTLSLTRITKEWRVALQYVLFSPFEVLRLAKLLRREKVDLVHASGGSWQFKGVVAAHVAKVPCVWHINDSLMPQWIRALFRLVQPLASGFIFSSHRANAYYRNLISGTRPEGIIPPPVDPEYFDPATEIADDNKIIAGFGDAPVIGTVANVNPIKGLETLIRAAGKLRQRFPRLRVVVVGAVHANQRSYFERLTSLASTEGVVIEWVGAQADVRPFLSRFDVYVCSSNSESWGMSLWEAMAMGCSIVSTDVGDVARHVLGSKAGFVVSAGDDWAMALRAEQLLNDAGLRQRMEREARQIACKVAGSELIVEETLEMYNRILQSHAGSKASRRRTIK